MAFIQLSIDKVHTITTSSGADLYLSCYARACEPHARGTIYNAPSGSHALVSPPSAASSSALLCVAAVIGFATGG